MFRVRRMFEPLLQMNEGAGRLDQALKKIRVAGVRFQPKLLENIVRYIEEGVPPMQAALKGAAAVVRRAERAGSYRLFADFSHEGEARTLASDAVWRDTHRLAGWAFVAAGLLTAEQHPAAVALGLSRGRGRVDESE